MIICQRCSTQNEDDSVFCISCGYRLTNSPVDPIEPGNDKLNTVDIKQLYSHLQSQPENTPETRYSLKILGLNRYNYLLIPEALQANPKKYVSLSETQIPDGVTDLNSCFQGCVSLVEPPVIPDGVTDMSFCFQGCSYLVYAPDIPESVTNIKDCFKDCPHNLRKKSDKKAEQNILEIDVKNLYDYLANKPLNDSDTAYVLKITGLNKFNYLLIPEALQANPDKYVNLSVTKLPNDIKNISWIEECKSILYPPSLESEVNINNLRAFLDEKQQNTRNTPYSLIITGLTLDNYTEIGEALRVNPTKYVDLSATKLPDGISMYSLFHSCKSLVYAPPVPNGVTNLFCSFKNCASLLKAPLIPVGVKNMNKCFQGCSSLTEAPEIPESVAILEDCFEGCSSLKKECQLREVQ